MLLKNNSKKSLRKSEGSWAVSYVDMLTLLLCFFIIFYNTTKQNGKNEIIIGLNKSLKLSDTKEINKNGLDQTMLHELNQMISSNNESKITQRKDMLEIQFENLSFFKSGKTEILPEARKSIYSIIEILKTKKEKIKIIVQGHTDPTKTKKQKNYSDNWELSAIRATSVLKIFLQEGFPQENLSAEGFADTKTNRNIATLTDMELAKQRKITLRIEPLRTSE